MLIIDTHADTLHRRALHPGSDLDITPDGLRRGGVSVQTMALFVGGSPALEDIARCFDAMWLAGKQMEEEGLPRLTDYRDAHEGQSAFIYSVEGCDLLNGDLALLTAWREKGVRMAALTWNYENCVGTPGKK